MTHRKFVAYYCLARMLENVTEIYCSVLSSETLEALKDFYAERDAHEKQFEDLKNQVGQTGQPSITMDAFVEDWNASQFWVGDNLGTIRLRH
jgi:hypothetical protein